MPTPTLRSVSDESAFALSIVQILVEERHEYHRQRHNSNTNKCSLKVGDVVKAHVQVNSSADKGVVGKLSYKAKGPFIITADMGQNSFEVI